MPSTRGLAASPSLTWNEVPCTSKVSLAGQARERRLAAFSPGAVFGEVALLDEEPRSATVTADEELVCYVLDDARFRTLTISQLEG